MQSLAIASYSLGLLSVLSLLMAVVENSLIGTGIDERGRLIDVYPERRNLRIPPLVSHIRRWSMDNAETWNRIDYYSKLFSLVALPTAIAMQLAVVIVD